MSFANSINGILTSLLDKFRTLSRQLQMNNAQWVRISTMALCFLGGIFLRGLLIDVPRGPQAGLVATQAPIDTPRSINNNNNINNSNNNNNNNNNLHSNSNSDSSLRSADRHSLLPYNSGLKGSATDGSLGGAFFLGVTMRFVSREAKLEFMALFKPLAAFVRNNEPDTLSYLLMESDKPEKKNQIYILERYRTKSAYVDVHRKSKPFLEFRSKLDEMLQAKKLAIEGDSYYATDIGYMDLNAASPY